MKEPRSLSDRQLRNICIGLLIFGLLQMTGDVAKIPALKGIGAAWMCSPCPKVFTAQKGLETFANNFYLEWVDPRTGEMHSRQITPELYAQVEGPYWRRNVYGAALSYGPVLAADRKTRPIFNQVCHYAMFSEKPLLSELGVDPASVGDSIRVRYEPMDGSSWPPEYPQELEVRR